MGRKAVELGADTFAFFTRNPRGGKAKDIDPKDVNELKTILKDNGFGPLVAHAPYTMNLSSGKDNVREFSVNILKEDLIRMEYLPGNYYNFHPGAHVGQGSETGTEMIVSALNGAMFPEMNTMVLLETMTGKGTEIGGTFEELKKIINGVNEKDHIGVCLDTCHIWDAGYAIDESIDRVLDRFDSIIGLDRLYAIHLNDSKNPCGARKDRHEKLGKGYIGEETIKKVVQHPALQGKPFILETPNDDEGYAGEIDWVRRQMITYNEI